jgi:hypothetical protein
VIPDCFPEKSVFFGDARQTIALSDDVRFHKLFPIQNYYKITDGKNKTKKPA